MAAWHRSRKADRGLRIAGVILCVLAYVAISRLVAIRPPGTRDPAGTVAYCLAAVGFICGCAGGALTTVGNHLFDEIEVCPRWTHTGADLSRGHD